MSEHNSAASILDLIASVFQGAYEPLSSILILVMTIVIIYIAAKFILRGMIHGKIVSKDIASKIMAPIDVVLLLVLIVVGVFIVTQNPILLYTSIGIIIIIAILMIYPILSYSAYLGAESSNLLVPGKYIKITDLNPEISGVIRKVNYFKISIERYDGSIIEIPILPLLRHMSIVKEPRHEFEMYLKIRRLGIPIRDELAQFEAIVEDYLRDKGHSNGSQIRLLAYTSEILVLLVKIPSRFIIPSNREINEILTHLDSKLGERVIEVKVET